MVSLTGVARLLVIERLDHLQIFVHYSNRRQGKIVKPKLVTIQLPMCVSLFVRFLSAT